MDQKKDERLSKREQQIMDIIYRKGEVSANQVLDYLPDPPGYSAVRAMLRVLEEKGRLRHKQDGLKYIYYPTVHKEEAKESALKGLLATFFNGSAKNAVATLIDMSRDEMKDSDWNRLENLIDEAKKEGK
jgi:BlaI family transcriptional regulator, penicillinase repressor